MKREQLERLDDLALLDEARRAGVARPEVLTREEQLDAIEAIEERVTGRREGSKGFLSRARTLLADFLERGLNLPHTADRVRTTADDEATSTAGDQGDEPAKRGDDGGEDDGETDSPDVATVTLAQIYVAQGHPERALVVLGQVLRAEPGNAQARRLQAKLQGLPVPADLLEDEGDEDDEDDVTVAPPVVVLAPSSASLVSGAESAKAALGANATPALSTEEVAAEAAAAAVEVKPVQAGGAPKPAPILDEIPLPERYGVDELEMIPVDPTTMYLYWEVRPETLGAAQRHDSRGALRLRLESVGVGGARRLLRAFTVGEVSDRQVGELPAGARCMAELGWETESGWRPLVTSKARQLPPAYAIAEPARHVVRWSQQQAVVLNPPSIDHDVADAIRDAVNNVTRPAPRPERPAPPLASWEPAVFHLTNGRTRLEGVSPAWASSLLDESDPFGQPAAPWTPDEVEAPYESREVGIGSSETLTLRRPLRSGGSSEQRPLGSSERGPLGSSGR